MRKKMNKKIAACGALSAALLLAGCANDGTAYRSDVYWAGQVNQAQEVKTVQIIAVMPARVTVDNRRDRSDSATMGTILGALAGAAVGAVVSDSPDAVVAGTVGGAALGNVAGKGFSGRKTSLKGCRSRSATMTRFLTPLRLAEFVNTRRERPSWFLRRPTKRAFSLIIPTVADPRSDFLG